MTCKFCFYLGINVGFKGFDEFLAANRLAVTLKPGSPLKSKKPVEILSSRKLEDLPEIYEPEMKR